MADKRANSRKARSREDASIERAGGWKCFSFLGCLFWCLVRFAFSIPSGSMSAPAKLEDSWCVSLSLLPACGRERILLKLTSWSLD
ncbi:hypothetical protein BDP55DRAFT_292767 [Colletotrichum godetiae]|uniref:Uncharacterized protein n=1 Tax=Colletotrichum godetiae TaxID=1209918 RepID=A0AAJ0EPC6_9PEZI|nr:uncharacterized protein BDP55DRAFT_292767 [Colletotrichum godetiae]KAK1671541.1 hypothetical protein BDP55DRAFT_292767 [Colletotrichum godetiae]